MITKILIAEDNTFAYTCYRNFLSKDETIEIIGHAQDGESAIKMYKERNPDLLILDLNLPKKNGLQVLEELAQFEKENPKCNVIVVSGEMKLVHELLNTRKVFIKILKPASMDTIMRSIHDFQEEQLVKSFSETKCLDLLMQLSINPFSKNGRLLTEAIKICYFNDNICDNLNLLYNTLGHKKSCSPEKIKSCLRTAIDNSNKKTDFKTLTAIFYTEVDEIEKGVSPKHFINGLIYSLKK